MIDHARKQAKVNTFLFYQVLDTAKNEQYTNSTGNYTRSELNSTVKSDGHSHNLNLGMQTSLLIKYLDPEIISAKIMLY